MAESVKYLVSIVIPTFNRARLVSETVQSVFDQKFKDLEVVVVDDGSTDDTRHALERFQTYPNFRYVLQENSGRSRARNHGLELAKGDYVMFLDSDDILASDGLEILMDIARQHPDSGLIAGNRQFVSEDLKERIPIEPHLLTREYYDQNMALSNGKYDFFPPSSYIVKRDVALKLNGFDSAMEPSEDLDFVLRCADVTRFSTTAKTAVFMRFHSGNTPSQHLRKAAIRVRTKHLESFDNGNTQARGIARMKAIWLYKIAADYYELREYRTALRFYLAAARTYPFLLATGPQPLLSRQLILSFGRLAKSRGRDANS